MESDGVPVKSLFSLNSDVVHMNVGSLGMVPREVTKARQAILDEFESAPEHVFRCLFAGSFEAAANLVADTYNSPREQLTLIDNVSFGISSVLDSLDLGPDDEILVTSLTYGGIRIQCEELARRRKVTLRELKVPLPFTHASVLTEYEAELGRTEVAGRRVAIVDHITSMASLLMPLEAILGLCRRFGVLSMVDGAHAPGQLSPVELDLSRLRPDFYAGNLYKWAFTARPCALLFVSAPFIDVVRPVMVSWFHHKPFRQRFSYRGCLDTSCIGSVPAAFRFTERLGGHAAIDGFVRPLLREGIKLVTEQLGTEPLCAEEYSAPFMRTVYLGPGFDARIDVVKAMTGSLYDARLFLFLQEHAKVASGMLNIIDGRCTFRISAHVFTTLDDFRRLADGLLNVRKRLETMTVDEAARLPAGAWD